MVKTKMERPTGSLRIRGVKTGDCTVTFTWKWARTCVFAGILVVLVKFQVERHVTGSLR